MLDQLTEGRVGRDNAEELLKGNFIPEDIDIDFIRKISEKIGDSPEQYVEIKRELLNIYSDMSRTLLNTPTEED